MICVPCGAGHEDPGSGDHGPRVADLGFKGGGAADEATGHGGEGSLLGRLKDYEPRSLGGLGEERMLRERCS